MAEQNTAQYWINKLLDDVHEAYNMLKGTDEFKQAALLLENKNQITTGGKVSDMEDKDGY